MLSSAVVDGFHKATLPISTGVMQRLEAMDVKLNGVTASTKPSSGRYSVWLICATPSFGCIEYIFDA